MENVEMGPNVGIMIIGGGTNWRCITTSIETQSKYNIKNGSGEDLCALKT